MKKRNKRYVHGFNLTELLTEEQATKLQELKRRAKTPSQTNGRRRCKPAKPSTE